MTLLFFRTVTRLCDGTFLGGALPLGYWLVSRELFGKLARLAIANALLNTILKETFQVPRPPGPHLIEASGWSFPSGHAQSAAALAVWLALESRRPGLAAGLAALAGLVAASRVVLGVHTVADVSVGLAVGAALALAAWRLSHPAPGWWRRLGHAHVALLLAAVAVLTLVLPGGHDGGAPGLAGLLAGFWVGDRLRGPGGEPRGARRVAAAAVIALPALAGLVALLRWLQAGLAHPLGAQLALLLAGLVLTMAVPALLRAAKLESRS